MKSYTFNFEDVTVEEVHLANDLFKTDMTWGDDEMPKKFFIFWRNESLASVIHNWIRKGLPKFDRWESVENERKDSEVLYDLYMSILNEATIEDVPEEEEEEGEEEGEDGKTVEGSFFFRMGIRNTDDLPLCPCLRWNSDCFTDTIRIADARTNIDLSNSKETDCQIPFREERWGCRCDLAHDPLDDDQWFDLLFESCCSVALGD